MKYIMTLAYNEPVKENERRALEIEADRKKSGEGFTATEILAQYVDLSEPRVIQIVEIEDTSKLIKWIEAYLDLAKIKIAPVVTTAEWKKAVAG
ncbi:unnamed protein product [marine sediment metagenome]|uniref:DUF3303 domain-containing protein n=1 Tax=marine sediment metagenome TaxID=412755 RepID=X0WY40_9ZZZZ